MLCYQHFQPFANFNKSVYQFRLCKDMWLLTWDKLYHVGIQKAFDKFTVSRATEKRDWCIFQDFGLKLIERAWILHQGNNQFNVKLKGKIFALDFITVNLCLEVFMWADFLSTKAAIKIYKLHDLKTSIPEYIFITEGKVRDVNALDFISAEEGSVT